MSSGFSIKRAGGLLAGVCALAACADSQAAGVATTYYLVTQVKPENVKDIFRRERGVHELCVVAAKLKKIPFQPFPAVPANFVFERKLDASDGKRTYHKETSYKITAAPPEQGCAYKIESIATTSIAADGKVRMTHQDERGRLTTDEAVPDRTEPVRQSKLDMFTEPRVINGVQLKCKADTCIVDPAVAIVAFGRRPVHAASRLDEASLYGSPLITEPLSLTVGKPIDVSEFIQQAGK